MINPAHTLNIGDLLQNFWRHRSLIRQMVWREVIGRYRGSILGVLWSFFNPLFMLVIYTFVFSVVFRSKWGQGAESRTEFAIIMFAGLIIFNLFVEVVNRSPSMVLQNANYVKKVVFPLEILPLVAFGSALFHTFISAMVLLFFYFIVNLTIHYTIIFFPIILLPLFFITLGISWFLASLGVYLRDVSQTVGILTSALLFTTPIFFPASALPEGIRSFLFLNPLTFIIEQTRNILIWGEIPHWRGLVFYTGLSVVVAVCGLLWFQKTRKGFADVI